MARWTLAIDFGTSFTTVATAVDGRVIQLEIDGSRYLPSAVAMDDGGTILTGVVAVQRARYDPESAVRLPKRALVAGPKVRLSGRTVKTTELVAAVLKRAGAEARAFHGGARPDEVILTHPAAWGDGELAALTKAATRAGLGSPRLIAEPVAAAAHYAVGCTAAECAAASRLDLAEGAHLAVYDLGGGTFDAAVVRRTGSGFVLAGRPGGDASLGGEDFDERLLDLVADRAIDRDPQAWEGLDPMRDLAARRAHSLLQREITESKEALSSHNTVNLAVAGYPAPFRVTRPEFTELIEADLRRSLGQLEATAKDADLSLSDLAAVALAGGSSRIPRISDLIAEAFGALPLTAPHPKCAVAHGALLRPGPDTPRPDGERLPIDPEPPEWMAWMDRRR